jgi:hypothetical protein
MMNLPDINFYLLEHTRILIKAVKNFETFIKLFAIIYSSHFVTHKTKNSGLSLQVRADLSHLINSVCQRFRHFLQKCLQLKVLILYLTLVTHKLWAY